jgi:hypothetical protein
MWLRWLGRVAASLPASFTADDDELGAEMGWMGRVGDVGDFGR